MSNELVIQIVLGVFAVSFLVVLWFNGRKEEVKNILYTLILKAEETYLHGENEKKLKDVLAKYEKFVPFYLSWFINKYTIVNKWIPAILLEVESRLGFKSTIDTKVNLVVNNVKNEAINFVVNEINNFAETAKNTTFFEDKNLISNEQIDELKLKTFDNYEKNFGIKITAKTDFKGNNEAGVQAEYKF